MILMGCLVFCWCNFLSCLLLFLMLVISLWIKLLFWIFCRMLCICFLVLVLMMCGFERQLLNFVVFDIEQYICVRLFLYIKLMISFSLCSILKQVNFVGQLVLIMILNLVLINFLVLLYNIVCLLNRLVLVLFLNVVLMMLVWVLLIVLVYDSVSVKLLFCGFCFIVIKYGIFLLLMNWWCIK